jgi:hypothetical protein
MGANNLQQCTFNSILYHQTKISALVYAHWCLILTGYLWFECKCFSIVICSSRSQLNSKIQKTMNKWFDNVFSFSSIFQLTSQLFINWLGGFAYDISFISLFWYMDVLILCILIYFPGHDSSKWPCLNNIWIFLLKDTPWVVKHINHQHSTNDMNSTKEKIYLFMIQRV